MKKLSDYQGSEALELWADMLEPLSVIINDKAFAEVVKSGASKIEIAKTALKAHSKEVTEILLRIDNTPIDGMNIVLRLVELITEIGQSDYAKSFFGYAGQAKKE